jgi:hypothetical protein
MSYKDYLDGLEDGFKIGLGVGFRRGYEEGTKSIYFNYQDGYNDGYVDGYIDAYKTLPPNPAIRAIENLYKINEPVLPKCEPPTSHSYPAVLDPGPPPRWSGGNKLQEYDYKDAYFSWEHEKKQSGWTIEY